MILLSVYVIERDDTTHLSLVPGIYNGISHHLISFHGSTIAYSDGKASLELWDSQFRYDLFHVFEFNCIVDHRTFAAVTRTFTANREIENLNSLCRIVDYYFYNICQERMGGIFQASQLENKIQISKRHRILAKLNARFPPTSSHSFSRRTYILVPPNPQGSFLFPTTLGYS